MLGSSQSAPKPAVKEESEEDEKQYSIRKEKIAFGVMVGLALLVSVGSIVLLFFSRLEYTNKLDEIFAQQTIDFNQEIKMEDINEINNFFEARKERYEKSNQNGFPEIF